jgi:DeoR/GlpR family transcriptional regulator of sugar metabolism
LATNRLINKRRDDICELLKGKNILSISELSAILNISKITIRRDLDYLAKEKKIKKIHGGAIIERAKDYEPPYMIRSLEMTEQKKAIGKLAASLIPENSLIFIDVGSTLLELAKNLPLDKNISVITNWIPIAQELGKKMFSNLFLLCGKVNCREMSIIGNYPLQFLDNFNIETCFIGVSGISIDHGLTDFTLEEIEMKKQMIRRAKKRIVLADHSKFDRLASIKICDLSDIDTIITSEGLDDKDRIKIEKCGVKVIISKKGDIG